MNTTFSFAKKRFAFSELSGNLRHLFLFIYLIAHVSCNTLKKENKYTIGFSQCTMANKWRKTMLEEMQRELSFHPGIKFIFKDANGNTQKQVEHIQELINQKIDLLIVCPNEAAPITPVMDKAFYKGIPTIIVDRRTLSQNYTAYVGANNYEVGADAARFGISILKGKGKVMELSDIPGSSADIDRHNGFSDILKKYPAIQYITKIYEEGDENPSGERLSRFLKSDPGIQLIFAQNDRLAFAASNVCKKLGLDEKVKIVGVDGLAGKNGGIDLVERGILKATVLYPTGGEEAILTGVNILEKEAYQKENRLTASVIDSSNVRVMKLQNVKVLEQQKKIDRSQKKIEDQQIITNNQTNIIYAISISLALALIFGSILFYYFSENKKINKKLEIQKNELEIQKNEISTQRNQLIELVAKVKEATDAKFNFFTNISHELRTPLTLILGPLEDSLSSSKLHFSIKNNLDFAHRNSIRLLRIINQLMDFRKIEENKMKLRASCNNISEFVVEITNAFRDFARKKSISYNVTSKVRDLQIWFDINMLDKVLFNLLSNAFKFTSERGFINVTVEKKGDDNTMVLIKVEDSGIGMTKDETEHAFDLFYQGHSASFKGTGLGLSLSRELINLHHGSIGVTSERGKGTTFEVTLLTGQSHLQPDEITSERPSLIATYEDLKIYTADIEPVIYEQEPSNTSEKEYSILIIEDNHDLRTFLKRRLSENFEIHEAENGNAGMLLAYDIVPDLIISDIILPGINGLQLTETFKLDIRTSHIPIILLTAKNSIEEQIEGIKLKADAFIVKPFNLEYVEESIKNLLKNRTVLREHYTSELPTEVRSHSSKKIDRKFINEFTSIVENNLGNENFDVENIYKEIGISKVQLYRKVKALLDYNVNDYILNVRMQKAKFLLANENSSISEVSYKVGFSSQAYFSKVFKSKFLVTPSEFKEKNKKII